MCVMCMRTKWRLLESKQAISITDLNMRTSNVRIIRPCPSTILAQF